MMKNTTSRFCDYEKDKKILTDFWLDYRAASNVFSYPTIWRLRLLLTSRVWEPEKDSRIWESALGQIDGFVMLWRRSATAAFIVLDSISHPTFTSPETIRAMLQWGDDRANEMAKEQRRTLEVYVSGGFSTELLAQYGYMLVKTNPDEHDVYFGKSLRSKIIQPALPEGYRIRQLEKTDDLEAYQALYGFAKVNPQHQKELLESDEYRHFVVVDADDAFVAYCECSVCFAEWSRTSQRVGWFDYVETIPTQQRKGLGRAILTAGLLQLQTWGAETAMLITMSTNISAVNLYQQAGFDLIEIKQPPVYQKKYHHHPLRSKTMAYDLIEIDTAPAIPGLIFRHFRGQSDFAKMSAIVTASAEADKVERVATAEDLAAAYAHLPNCDPAQDMIFVEINGETVGYSRCWWREEENGPFIYSFVNFLTPDWRNTGVPAVMLHWLETRLRTIAQTHPAEREKFLEGSASQNETNAAELLERENYQAIRYGWEMLRPNLDNITDIALPAGLEIRPAQPEQYRLLWDAAIEAFRGGWGFSEPTEEDYLTSLENPSIFQPHLWQIAWDTAANQVAGQVRPCIEAAHNEKFNLKQGKLDIVCVGHAWRKRGLARALIALSLHKLKEQGMTQVILGVDSENVTGATRVYEDCGFHVAKRQTVYRKAL